MSTFSPGVPDSTPVVELKLRPGGGDWESAYFTVPSMPWSFHFPEDVKCPTWPWRVCFVGDTVPAGAEVAVTLTWSVDDASVVCPLEVTVYV